MEQPLMNILDQCIDRIRAGESVETCLKDYPDYADELRDMLHIGITLGELVTAAPVAATTQDRLQQQLADRIDNRENHMQIRTREKRKRRTFGMMSLGAAAVLALIMGVGIGVFATMSAFNPSALAPVVAEPTEPTHQLSFRHNPALFSIPREGDTPLYFDVELGNFGEASEYVRIATPTGLEVIDMEPVSLQGWTLSNQDELIYTFGDEHMYSSGIQVHSGYGNEHYGNVYIGQTEPIWRLDDRLILRDANDEVLLEAAVRDLIPATSPNFYDNSLIIYSGVDRGSFTYLPIYVDVINPGTDSEHIRIENWSNFQDFDLSGWTLSSDTGVSYTLPDVEWYQPIGSGPHINIYTLPKATSAGKYHIGLPEPVWQSANTLTLTHPDGLSGTLALKGDADTPQSPLYDPEYIRPVYRYNDEVGTFMVTFDGQPSTIYQVQVVNPGDRDREYIKIFAHENESVAPVPMLSLEGWTLSDDDGNVFVFDSTYLPTTESSLWIYTRDGVKKMDEVYMARDNAIWDMDDTLTLTNSLGGIVLQANVGALSPNGDSQYIRPVYRYNDAAGVFMVVADGQPTAIFQLQVMNPGYRDHEYINIFAPANVSMNNVRPISLDGWTISDDDGNSFTFEGSTLPASGLRVYTGPGENKYGEVYMGRDSALWDEDDTLTLSNALGDIVLQANIGTLTYTLQSTQTLSNSIYFEDPDIAPTGWMPPFMLNVDVIFPGQEGENVRISQRYGGEMPDLAGWTISDDDGNSYRIPYHDSDNTSSYLSLYTESGTDEPGTYYMGFDAPIWQLDDSLTITRPSDGATYNIIVEDTIESPWHLGNPPTPELMLEATPMPAGCPVEPSGVNLNLRLHPDSNAYVIEPLQPDDVLEIIRSSIEWDEDEGRQYLWLTVKNSEGTLGWVRADMVEPVAECADQNIDALIHQQKEQLANWPSACSIETTTSAYLREYADSASQTTAFVSENQLVDLLGAQIDDNGLGILWYRVRTQNNEIGWIRQDAAEVPSECSMMQPPVPNLSAVATAEMNDLLRRPAICTGQVASGSRVYLRAEDHTLSDYITELPEGLSFDVLQIFRKQDYATLSWYEVRINIVQGDSPAMKGWLLSSEVEETSPCPQ